MRARLIQYFLEFLLIENAVFEFLSHHNCIRRTSFDAQIAERAHVEMVNPRVDRFLLLSIGLQFLLGNDFDTSIRARQLARLTTGAAMFVLLIMRHCYFAPETFRQFQLSRAFIFRIQLRHNFLVMREVITCQLHPRQ